MEEKNSEKKERKMRDSGIPWIGEVPEGWEFSKIKYHCTMKSGDNITALDISDNGEYPVYGGNGLRGFYKIYNKNGNHILIGRQGALAGNVHLVNGKFWATDHAVIVTLKNDVFINYFFRMLESMNLNQYAFDTAAQPGLSVSRIMNLNIVLPNLKEQHRIADFLGSKCSEIDTLIENLRARMESAKEYKKAVITEAVTKGLDKDAKMKDSGVEWIGEIPEGWKVVRFKHIASIKSNLVQPDKYMKYPQIAPDNIEKDTGRLLSHQTVEESGVISGNHLFYRGQILYSKIRPNLNKLTVAPFDGLCSADMYPIESKLPTLFMVYSMLSTYFVLQVSLIIQDRVKMPKINQEELGEIKVAVPSQQEMLTIADYLDSKCSEIDALLQNYEYQIATLEEYKKSLIYEYVTGKKEVPEA
ncbi:restriction endonuclease subunit S [Blautia wexlerae]|uniref:restriction endonuclease subunit S n=1 Tax=Blautia wexlerae TaxID=418240 RepID=UPI001D074B43|nr:restriction endonuclease subunit S [Blautia wexlerae]MCB6686539.1 restriction endonuclease subunit S [Blautia wexlerae]